MKVVVLALDDVFDSGMTVLLDTLAAANELAALHGFGSAPFDVTLAGLRKRLRTALGFSATVPTLDTVRKPDWIVVPALNAKQADALAARLQARDIREAGAQLRARHDAGVHIAGACIGTFVLAEAGLLDDHEATTTWSLAPFFRQRYPGVSLDDSRMVVESGRVVTAGAAMGHLDLALWLVRRVSPELADRVARFMLIDQRASQAHYIIPDHLAHADPLISKFERWARDNLPHGFSLDAAANALSVHPRTLQRRTEAILGKSPLAFVQDLRIERARHLIAAGRSLEAVAAEVGYADAATLRTLLRRKLGHGVRAMRSPHAGRSPAAR